MQSAYILDYECCPYVKQHTMRAPHRTNRENNELLLRTGPILDTPGTQDVRAKTHGSPGAACPP